MIHEIVCRRNMSDLIYWNRGGADAVIYFKLRELRKKYNLTQRELGEILNVSHQTISKWEKGVVLPDTSLLPQISAYFGVSVDALLGLAPLEQKYCPSASGTPEYWKDQKEILKNSRNIMWNEDYMDFLIKKVWKIYSPITVLDCGCGYGALGILLMPLLPPGSQYVGIDFSPDMIKMARKHWMCQNMNGKFYVADILEYQPQKKYDLVISQAVLRHVDNGNKFLKRMISFLKTGGILVSLECNREFETSGLYIEGMDYESLCEHNGLKKLWQTELKKQNRDYSIAMKIPHYMKEAGLKNVSCRMNDRVTVLEPEQQNYSEIFESIKKAGGWEQERTEGEMEQTIAFLMNHGMSRNEAEDYCSQQNGVARYFRERQGKIAMTVTSGIMISYGWK